MGEVITITKDDLSRLELLTTHHKPPMTVKGIPVNEIKGIGVYVQVNGIWKTLKTKECICNG